jgi:hypothetical protein
VAVLCQPGTAAAACTDLPSALRARALARRWALHAVVVELLTVLLVEAAQEQGGDTGVDAAVRC